MATVTWKKIHEAPGIALVSREELVTSAPNMMKYIMIDV